MADRIVITQADLEHAVRANAQLEAAGFATTLTASLEEARSALKKQKLEGVARRLVGFTVLEPKVVGRHGMDVYVDGKKVDIVRSGTVTPTVNEAIGTTYVPKGQAQPGMKLEIDVRGKRVPAEVVKLPFVPHRTKR